MKIAMIGTGYVGLVTGAGLADVGNSVLCLDIDAEKIAILRAGGELIYDPGLGSIVARNTAAGRLGFTTSYDEALAHADVVFIAVPTPADEDGSADVSCVLSAARSIGKSITRPVLVVNKSTVPVGTADEVRAEIAHQVRRRDLHIPVTVVSNPEFLKEGSAVNDFMRPDRIVVGCDDPAAMALMHELYAPFNRNHDKFIEMDVRSAELTKYAANAMLATRISFMNELANLAELLDADIEAVRFGIGADPRIGAHFLYAGLGYGGSCFPKDVKALAKTALDRGRKLHILSAIETVNEMQKSILYEKICRHFGGEHHLEGKMIALWGLSFKPNTNDMREAPSLVLIRKLLAANCRVKCYDPAAREEATRKLVAEHGAQAMASTVSVFDSAWEAVDGCDALVLVTEWKEFLAPDWPRLADVIRGKVIFDGRNLYDPAIVRNAGLRYYGIGRRTGETVPLH